eukprot:3137809-Pyramimonas_sp.AAC.1
MEVVTTANPYLSERLWIDDLSLSAVGSPLAVEDALVNGITAVSDALIEESLELAPKSVVICSDMETAREVVRRLRRRGITAQITKQAPYLGVDLGSGRRLARATRTKRMEQTRRQHGKVRKFAASTRRFKILQKVERA